MDFLKRFLGFNTEQHIIKSQDLGFFSANDTGNSPIWIEDDFQDLADGAYGDNSIVYAAINELSKALSESVLILKDKEGNIIEDHPLLDLWQRPNPAMSQQDLCEQIISDLYLSGNVFLKKFFAEKGRQVVELFPLRPDTISVLPDEANFIRGYEYRHGTSTRILQPEEVLRTKFYNPTNAYVGQSPLKACLKQIAVDNEATRHTKKILENGGVPVGFLSMEQAQLPREEQRRISSMFKTMFGGKNKGSVGILTGGAKYQPAALDMKGIALLEVSTKARKMILAALGVPGILLGFDEATYANYGEARRSFWEETMPPLQKRIAYMLENDQDLNPTQLKVEFDNSQVAALRDNHTKKLEQATIALNAGIITTEEAREHLGLDPKKPQSEDEKKRKEAEAKNRDLQRQQAESKKQMESLVLEKQSKDQIIEKAEEELELLTNAIGRISLADEFFDRYRHWAKKELKLQSQQFLSLFTEITKSLDNEQLKELNSKLDDLEPIWQSHAQESIEPLSSRLLAKAGKAAQVEADLETAFDLDNKEAQDFLKKHNLQFSKSIASTTKDQIKSVLTKTFEAGATIGETQKAIKDLLTGKGAAHRAEMIARTETIRTANEGTRQVYKSNGIKEMQWLALTDSCAYCQSLNGKTVSTSKAFVGANEKFQPQGATAPLSTKFGAIRTPPAHPMCRCTIIPVMPGKKKRK